LPRIALKPHGFPTRSAQINLCFYCCSFLSASFKPQAHFYVSSDLTQNEQQQPVLSAKAKKHRHQVDFQRTRDERKKMLTGTWRQ
jgi:hypothetical protein